jgi:hypothetical protein
VTPSCCTPRRLQAPAYSVNDGRAQRIVVGHIAGREIQRAAERKLARFLLRRDGELHAAGADVDGGGEAQLITTVRRPFVTLDRRSVSLPPIDTLGEADFTAGIFHVP